MPPDQPLVYVDGHCSGCGTHVSDTAYAGACEAYGMPYRFCPGCGREGCPECLPLRYGEPCAACVDALMAAS